MQSKSKSRTRLQLNELHSPGKNIIAIPKKFKGSALQALEPCPFCGSRCLELQTIMVGTGADPRPGTVEPAYFIHCPICLTDGPKVLNAENMILAWNRRTWMDWDTKPIAYIGDKKTNE